MQMSLFGYISTSRKEDTAYKFAWENQAMQKKKVVFKIKFQSDSNYYDMNAFSDFPDEDEILLAEGTPFVVESVEDDP